MFAGHFGLAAAAKSVSPKAPLWALMLGTQLLDVFFVPLLMSGVETLDGSGYGGAIIHADYTHSLAGALLIAVIAGMLSKRLWGKGAGRTVGIVVFSHWLLDLIVHRADLPILPGNLGGFPLLGFGVWEHSGLSIAMESVLIGAGSILYLRSVWKKSSHKGRAIASAAFMGFLMAAALVTSVMDI